MPLPIEALPVQKSVIDLTAPIDGDFGLDDFVMTKVLDDILLVEYIDINEDGTCIKRGSIWVPTNAIQTSWRKAKVLLAGPLARNCTVGDIVIFPNNLGVVVANIEIDNGDGIYKVSKGIFLNEARIFGICKHANE